MTEATEHACMHAKPVEKGDFPMDLELVGSLGIFLPNVVICRRGNWVPKRPRLLFREEDGLAGWGWGTWQPLRPECLWRQVFVLLVL